MTAPVEELPPAKSSEHPHWCPHCQTIWQCRDIHIKLSASLICQDCRRQRQEGR